MAKIAFVQLDDQQDSIKWSLTRQGSFTVQSMYKHLINQVAMPLNKLLWKLKLPLKIKIFIWFLIKGVILTKDNLKKRKWKGDDRCCFCDNKETIQHLFFNCHVAKFVWRVCQVAFNLEPPKDVIDLFRLWDAQTDQHQHLRYLICMGSSAILWSIWLFRNEGIFDKKQLYSYLQVVFRTTYWTRFWITLQKKNDKPFLKWACRMMETLAMEIFAKHGWSSLKRLSA